MYEHLGGVGLTRSNFAQDFNAIKNKDADVIVHCAFNSAKTVNTEGLHSYLYDNVFLTKELTLTQHKKFVFISTVDVYPKTNSLHEENKIIPVEHLRGMYAVTKLMSESIVANNCSNYLILRCSALLGKYARRNSLIRIVEDGNCTLTLTADSVFNYVLYSDIMEFIKIAVERDLTGIYNVASSGNITLSEIENMRGACVKYGTYHYNVGNIDNSKAAAVWPAFNKNSKEVATQFIRERQ